MNQTSDYIWYMKLALEEAEKAYSEHEVPVGAVLVDDFKKIYFKSHNLKEKNHDVSAHAEMICLREFGQENNNWRLKDMTLIVTLEPCPMCLSAMQQARVKKVVFGAYDYKGGSLSLGMNLHQNKGLNHNIEMIGGILEYDCAKILSDFFKERRASY